jgi:hypothetical protein
MKHLFFLAGSVLLSSLGAVSLSAQTVFFADNFNPPSSLWSNTTGNWTAAGGNYFPQVPNNNPLTMTLLPFDLTGYTLTVTVNALGDSGIYVRTNAAGTQYVALILGGLGYGQGVRSANAGTSIYWADSGNPTETVNLVTGVFTPGNTYTVTVKAVGNTFSAYINGSSTAVTTFTDGLAGNDGRVGLYVNQPNTVTGSGSGPPTTYSTFSLQGTAAAVSQPYYFSDLVFGGGYQTTLTYVNYSPQTVTCVTNFYFDTGAPMLVPFGSGTASTRTDVLQPGQSIHDQTLANLNAANTEGWGQASCNGALQASLLYRLYNAAGVPVGEASVNAETAPTTKFVTFAQTATGIAYANPSTTQSAIITIDVNNTAGTMLASTTISLAPLAHGSANVGPLLGLQSFSGFVELTSTVPIISLSVNAEAFPVFSSLPPGDLPSTATLVP